MVLAFSMLEYLAQTTTLPSIKLTLSNFSSNYEIEIRFLHKPKTYKMLLRWMLPPPSSSIDVDPIRFTWYLLLSPSYIEDEDLTLDRVLSFLWYPFMCLEAPLSITHIVSSWNVLVRTENNPSFFEDLRSLEEKTLKFFLDETC